MDTGEEINYVCFQMGFEGISSNKLLCFSSTSSAFQLGILVKLFR